MVRDSLDRAYGVGKSGIITALLGGSALAMLAGPAYAQNAPSADIASGADAGAGAQDSQGAIDIPEREICLGTARSMAREPCSKSGCRAGPCQT